MLLLQHQERTSHDHVCVFAAGGERAQPDRARRARGLAHPGARDALNRTWPPERLSAGKARDGDDGKGRSRVDLSHSHVTGARVRVRVRRKG